MINSLSKTVKKPLINGMILLFNFMKTYIVLLLLCFTINSYAQSVESTEITQNESVKLITSIVSFDVFPGKQLCLGILKASNGSGSANLPESDEVSFNILISVAHYDENPETKVFSIGPFIAPKVTRKIDDGSSVTLFVKNGVMKKRKTTKIIVSETKVQIE